MADEQQKSDAAENGGGGDQPAAKPVKIKLTPRVGRGGGESSSRLEVPNPDIETR